MKQKWKKITAVDELSGQLYIKIEGSNTSYKAYAIDVWAERRKAAGYSATSIEHVRACCRKQVDERTGRVNTLPDGLDAAKHSNRIYIYETSSFLPKDLLKSDNKTLPFEEVEIDRSITASLHSFKYQAMINQSPIKLEMTFYPDGSIKYIPISGTETDPSTAIRSRLFAVSWLIEIAQGCNPSINVQIETEKYLNAIMYLSTDHNLLLDFKARCLWCAAYKPHHSKINTRYHQSHRGKFFVWKKQVVSEYKRDNSTPKIDLQSQSLPALLRHPVIIHALHYRLTETFASIAKSREPT